MWGVFAHPAQISMIMVISVYNHLWAQNPDPHTVHGETHRKKNNLIASGDHFLYI